MKPQLRKFGVDELHHVEAHHVGVDGVSMRRQHERMNQHVVRWPGTNGPLYYYDEISKGEFVTLRHLLDDPEGIAAVLMADSFFPRMDASRSYYFDEFWPPRYCARELRKMAYTCWRLKSEYWGWHFACTQVLADKR